MHFIQFKCLFLTSGDINLLETNIGIMCRRPEPPLAVGASQVRQGAPLLKPAVHSHLDVTVGVPAKWTISIYLLKRLKFNKICLEICFI